MVGRVCKSIVCLLVVFPFLAACGGASREDSVFNLFPKMGFGAKMQYSENGHGGVIIIKTKPVKYVDFQFDNKEELEYSRSGWFGVLWTDYQIDREKSTISLYRKNKELLLTILIINSNTMRISEIGKGMYAEIYSIDDLPDYIIHTNVSRFYIDKTITTEPRNVDRKTYFQKLLNDESLARSHFFQGHFNETNLLYNY